MTKKEFSYIVFSSCGDNVQEIVGVYKDLDGASYGARSALSTLFPKHGDEAKIIRCEIISTEEARVTYEKINEATGWEPTTKIQEGIEKTVSWYKENEDYLKDLVYVNE